MKNRDKVQELIDFLEHYVNYNYGDDLYKHYNHHPWRFPNLLRKPLRLWFEKEKLIEGEI